MRLNKNIVVAGTTILLIFMLTSAMAEVSLKLDETEITGARELPKILYIVPWKKTAPDSRPLPMKSMMDEVLSPINMDVFRRQVRYYEFTHPAPEQEAAPK